MIQRLQGSSSKPLRAKVHRARTTLTRGPPAALPSPGSQRQAPLPACPGCCSLPRPLAVWRWLPSGGACAAGCRPGRGRERDGGPRRRRARRRGRRPPRQPRAPVGAQLQPRPPAGPRRGEAERAQPPARPARGRGGAAQRGARAREQSHIRPRAAQHKRPELGCRRGRAREGGRREGKGGRQPQRYGWVGAREMRGGSGAAIHAAKARALAL
jgi:hypothetical protein